MCLNILSNQYFEAFIINVIILNTFCLALDKYPNFNVSVREIVSLFNVIFTAIFTFECLIKMVALGLKEFFYENFNKFDLFIVIVSILEMQLSKPDETGFLSSLRALRLFKIFKLFQAGDLRILIDSITFTLTTIGDYVILLLLFIYVFALMGMNFFAG